MAVDEVGEGSLLGGSPKPEAAKKRLSSAGSNSSQAESNRPPRRKAGPISSDSLSKWRRRWRREMSSASSVASSASSTISSMSDLDSAPASPYSADLCSGDNLSIVGTETEPSTSSLNGSVDEKLNGELRSRKRSASASRFSPPAEKKSREDEMKTRLDESTLKEKKILMGRFVRKLARGETVMKMILDEMKSLCIVDRRICLRYALREARRFRRKPLVDLMMQQLNQIPDASSIEIV
ncbi:unnamed protein product [Gongylonema pulchrum]|uniref:INTS6/SAGE1/DDX26B/CT45 C-terminal domain-containing protein n=1 Tax=Gongylonema pulchrum TaxID=637853 RepID=A0A183E8Y5_9BILA|nr:unnamed protein product [Gongylonema pulchrum]